MHPTSSAHPPPSLPQPPPHNELPTRLPSVGVDPARHAVNALLSAVTNLGVQLGGRRCQADSDAPSSTLGAARSAATSGSDPNLHGGRAIFLKGPVKTISNCQPDNLA